MRPSEMLKKRQQGKGELPEADCLETMAQPSELPRRKQQGTEASCPDAAKQPPELPRRKQQGKSESSEADHSEAIQRPSELPRKKQEADCVEATKRPSELPRKKQQGKNQLPEAEHSLDRVITLPAAASAWADQGVDKRQLDDGSLSNGELIQEVKEVLMEALYGSAQEPDHACQTLHSADLVAPSSNKTAKTPPSNGEILKEVKEVLMVRDCLCDPSRS